MKVADWLGLQPTHNPQRWFLPIEPHISVRSRFLFGGCALGAAVAALEETTGRPAIWATAQYVSYGKVGTTMDIDVHISAEGRKTTQARATGHVDGEEIVVVNAALGHRDLELTEQWSIKPEVVLPQQCTERERWDDAESLGNHLEQRWALHPDAIDGPSGTSSPSGHGPGRVCLWVRMPHEFEPSAATLAVLGDWVPMGIANSTATPINSNSLDNTIRVLGVVPTEWYLLDIEAGGIRNGFGHGQLRIWSESGVLMAMASQSVLVRERRPDENGMPRAFRENTK